MELDSMTFMVATALVVLVGGTSFLIETVWHSGSTAARLWSLSFIAAMTSTIAFTAWYLTEGSWVAVAVGNAAFTCSLGFILLGCLSFNGRSLRGMGITTLLVCLATVVAALVERETEDGWGGSTIRFAGTALFAVLGAIESRRGAMSARPASGMLAVVLTVAGVYYIGRTIAFLLLGPSDPLFHTWFGTPPASIVTIGLIVVAVGSLSVLRATENMPEDANSGTLAISPLFVLDRRSFELITDSVLVRAERAGKGYAVIALRIEDLAQISTAFGKQEAEEVLRRWQEAVLAAAPLPAVIGESDSSNILIGVPVDSTVGIQRLANQMQQGVNDALLSSTVVSPALGTGVATAEFPRARAAALVDAAVAAARRSAAEHDGSVVLSG